MVVSVILPRSPLGIMSDESKAEAQQREVFVYERGTDVAKTVHKILISSSLSGFETEITVWCFDEKEGLMIKKELESQNHFIGARLKVGYPGNKVEGERVTIVTRITMNNTEAISSANGGDLIFLMNKEEVKEFIQLGKDLAMVGVESLQRFNADRESIFT